MDPPIELPLVTLVFIVLGPACTDPSGTTFYGLPVVIVHIDTEVVTV